VVLKARGKVNLALNIVHRREDGFHMLDGVMQSIDLFDIVYMEKAGDIQVLCGGVYGENIAIHAAQAFFAQSGMTGGVHIRIDKRIPMMAGLGGGSADAAAVLYGLNILYQTRLSQARLCSIGVQIGADVPFCLTGGTARAKGVGETLMPIHPKRQHEILLLKPQTGLATRDVYEHYDRFGGEQQNIDMLISGLQNDDEEQIACGVGNALERSAVTLCDDIAHLKKSILQHGAFAAAMTGSGSAVFGLFRDKAPSISCSRLWSYTTKTCAQGISVVTL
jgi:4-diphosphocytidyl-2-C-methyl-D-erythritol kinase